MKQWLDFFSSEFWFFHFGIDYLISANCFFTKFVLRKQTETSSEEFPQEKNKVMLRSITAFKF